MTIISRKVVPALAGVVIVLSALMGLTPPQQVKAYTCPTTSSRSYDQGGMLQWDLEDNNVVRPNYNHPDKTLYMRGHKIASGGTLGFVNYGASHDEDAPQFATLFKPSRVPAFTNNYKIYKWNWGDPPNPGTRASTFEVHGIPSGYPSADASVTMLGVQTTAGEVLRSPTTGYNLGDPWGKGSVVINADSAHHSITLHFTREDTITAGYTIMIEGVCVDPNLQSLYDTLDNPDRNPPPSQHYGAGNTPHDGTFDYDLPGLTAGQIFGAAQGTEIRLVIRDNGDWLDPRAKNDWWRIRPGTPDAPPLISPGNGSTTNDTTPTFKWGAAAEPSHYEIQFSDTANFSAYYAVVLEDDTFEYTPGAGDEFDAGTHYWRVRSGPANPFSEVWSFEIDLTPPGAPRAPVSPENGAVVIDKPKLTWTAPTGEAAAAYHVEIATDDGFTNLLPTPAEVSGRSYSTSSLTMPLDHYYWHVQARDAAGNWGPYSATFNFGRGPSGPTLSEPGDKKVLSTSSPTFTWVALTTTGIGSDYHLQVDVTGGDFDPPLCNSVEANVSRSGCTLPADGTYKWHVRGSNQDGDFGAWSSEWTFTLNRKPPAPTTVAPDGPTNHTAPDFEWTRPGTGETVATSYAITVKAGKTIIHTEEDVTDIDAGCDTDTSCVLTSPWTFGEGTYSFTVTPSNSYGTGPASAARTFIIDTTAPDIPINSSPKNLSLVTKAVTTLKTNGVKTATNYDFKVSLNEDCASDPGLITGSNTKSSLPVALPDYGVYYFCARASDAAGNISGWSYPTRFSYSLMKSPKDNSSTTDTTPSFKWGSYRGATTWEIRYGLNSDLSGEPIYAGTAKGYTPVAPLPYGLYYWQMRINGGTWMPVQKFTISNMKKPTNNYVTSDTTPSFSWTTYTGAPGWDLAYTDNPDGDPTDGTNDTVISGLLGTAKSYTVPAPLPDGEYFWSVLDTGGSNWMPPAKFFITHMTAPKNESFSTKSTVTFKWKSVLDATGYHLYIDTDDDPSDATPVDLLPTAKSYKTTLGRVTRYYWTVVADTPGGPVTMPVFTFVVQ